MTEEAKEVVRKFVQEAAVSLTSLVKDIDRAGEIDDMTVFSRTYLVQTLMSRIQSILVHGEADALMEDDE